MTPGHTQPARHRTWYERAWRNLRKRWVQVTLVALAGLCAAGLSWKLLVPRVDRQADRAAGKFQFMHCTECKTELAYSPEMEGKRCPRCQPPKTGFYVATEETIKSVSGGKSPERWAVLAVTLELLAALGGVVYLLYLPVPDPAATFYVCHCPHCHQRLRFRQVSLGGIGQCSRCKRPLRFPGEDDAVRETDLVREETARPAALDAGEEEFEG